MPSDRVNEYLKSVCAEVRWRQAHDAVREELAAHIEDQTEAYMRSGMERETAERKAVESMGSPAETGLRLDASYRPKPQWGPVIMLTALLMISAACRFMEYGNGGSSLGKFIIAACIGCGLFVWLYNADLYRLAGLSWQAYIAVLFQRTQRDDSASDGCHNHTGAVCRLAVCMQGLWGAAHRRGDAGDTDSGNAYGSIYGSSR